MDSLEILLPLLLGAILIDVVAGFTWWPPYFRIGIPLFVQKRPFQNALPELPDVAELSEKFSGPWVMPIRFKRLSSTQIAARESFWGGFFKLTYTPLVHGLLEADHTAREFKIVGRANAFPIVFVAFFAVPFSIDMSSRDPIAILFLVALFGGLFLIQYVRYGKVLQHARQSMEGMNETG